MLSRTIEGVRMPWIYLIAAGLAEVVWATTMKYTQGFTKFGWSAATLSAMSVSIYFLSLALKDLPMSTAYAIWVGIGAIGVAIIGMAFLGEAVSPAKLLFLSMIVAGIIGLKLAT
jgi:quaternary ammonium compound-resistance protein SugE